MDTINDGDINIKKSTLQDYHNINRGEQICLLLRLSNDLLDDIGCGGEDVIVKHD